MKFRKEFDSLGEILVPADKYWGASTQRSNKHFDIGDFLVRPIVIKSIAMIKRAAAIVNAKNGSIDKKLNNNLFWFFIIKLSILIYKFSQIRFKIIWSLHNFALIIINWFAIIS